MINNVLSALQRIDVLIIVAKGVSVIPLGEIFV